MYTWVPKFNPLLWISGLIIKGKEHSVLDTGTEHDDRRSWHPPHQFTRQILIFIWRSPDFGHNTEEGRTWPA